MIFYLRYAFDLSLVFIIFVYTSYFISILDTSELYWFWLCERRAQSASASYIYIIHLVNAVLFLVILSVMPYF